MTQNSADARFWSKVEMTDTCWNWIGGINSFGYANFWFDGRTVLAHRYAYRLIRGDIPAGLHLDHECHRKHCVNPAHLRLATNKQNKENLLGAMRNSKSGVRGVYFSNRFKKWIVAVGHNQKRYYGGSFAKLEDAEQSAIALRNSLFTHNDADRQGECA